MFTYSGKLERLPLPNEAVSLIEGDRTDARVAPEWTGGTLTPLPLCECGLKEGAAESLTAEAGDGRHAAKLSAPHPSVRRNFIEGDARHEDSAQPRTPVHAEPLCISREKRMFKRPSPTKHLVSKGEDLIKRCTPKVREAHLGTVPRRTRLGRGLPFLHA